MTIWDDEVVDRGQRNAIDGSVLSDETLALMEAVKTLHEAREALCCQPSLVIFQYVSHAEQYVDKLLQQHLFAEDSAEMRTA
jgi:hypothetical protein